MSVKLSAPNKVELFDIEKYGISSYIACQPLVLAAGLWTPLMYQRLLPSSAITLKATLNAGDWILFRNPLPATKRTIAFITLDDISGRKTRTCRRDGDTIWLIGSKDYNPAIPSLGNFAEPNEEMIKELIGRAEQILEKLGELEIVGKGRAIRLATDSIIPIISKVEAKDISDNSVYRKRLAESLVELLSAGATALMD